MESDGSNGKAAPRPTLLKVGSEGEAVKKIQEVLGLDADGIFGQVTAKYVMVWQAGNGLEADGIVGPKTYQKMVG